MTFATMTDPMTYALRLSQLIGRGSRALAARSWRWDQIRAAASSPPPQR